MSNVHYLEEKWKAAHQQAEAFKESDEPELPLNHGGGGGTSDGMDTVDAKIAAAEARTDTKFAQLRGDLNVQFGEVKTQLASKAGTGAMIATVVGTGLGLLAAVLSMLALGANRFDAGMTVRSAIESGLTESNKRDDAQDAKLDEILKRLPPPKS